MMNAYCHAVDYGDTEGWADCFTEDGAYEIRSRCAGIRDRTITPQSAIREYAAKHPHAPEVWGEARHRQPGDRARRGQGDSGSRSGSCSRTWTGTSLVSGFGRYLDTLVKEADGAWRL